MFIRGIQFVFDLLRLLAGDFLLRRKQVPNNLNNIFDLSQKKTKNILIVSLTNSGYMFDVESLLGKALNNYDYNIYYLTNWKNARAISTFKKIGGRVILQHWFYLKNFYRILFKKITLPQTGEDLKNFFYDGVNLGVGVYASVSRKFKVGQIDFENKIHKLFCVRYLFRSLVYYEVAKEIVKKLKPDLVLANEKGYIASSEIFQACIKNNIDFIQWVGCPEPNSLAFKRYHKNNIKDHPLAISKNTWSKYKTQERVPQLLDKVKKIFDRGYLEGVWFKYNCLKDNTQNINKDWLVKKYDLDPSKKIAVLFSHVMWDGNLFYGEDLFKKGFEQWYLESVKTMLSNPGVNWLVKIHPANRWKHNYENIKSDYREIGAILEESGKLPESIKFIYPEDEVSPYSLFQFIDYGLTVRGTVGSELPCFGVPILTAGTGRYSGLGFTNDSLTKEEYLDKVRNIQNVTLLSEEQKYLANLHAYLFFQCRPLKISSFTEVWHDKNQEIIINVDRPEQMSDLDKFARWALFTKEEDFLSSNENIPD